MLRFILLFNILFAASVFICAQTINNGLYVNEERNEFVIIKNDTVQFRYYNDDAFASYTIGEGILKKKRNGRYIILLSTSLIEKTSMLYRNPRNDDKLSIQVLARDSFPILGMWIKISHLQDKKNHAIGFSDKYGQWLLNENFMDFFDNKDVLIHTMLIGYTESEKKMLLEKGYDYIIISRIPEKFSGSVARGNGWEIFQLNDSEISIGIKRKGGILKKLHRIKNDYPLSDFPFDKDLKSY